jgi:hypothetical protein
MSCVNPALVVAQALAGLIGAAATQTGSEDDLQDDPEVQEIQTIELCPTRDGSGQILDPRHDRRRGRTLTRMPRSAILYTRSNRRENIDRQEERQRNYSCPVQ